MTVRWVSNQRNCTYSLYACFVFIRPQACSFSPADSTIYSTFTHYVAIIIQIHV